MPLTDLEVKAAKPRQGIIKLSDGGGLQLWVTPHGAKRWRLAYRFGGVQKVIALGVYKTKGGTSQSEARAAREEAKKLLADGQVPAFVKRLAKATKATASANTFEVVAGELLEKKRREGKADRTVGKFEWLMTLARPTIGASHCRDNRSGGSRRASRCRSAWPA